MRPEHTLKQCLRYCPSIATILNRWPDVTPFTPEIAPVTFSARLRDAINGIVRYHQNEVRDLINVAKLLAIHKQIVVSNRSEDNIVLVGPKDKLDVWSSMNEVIGTEVLAPITNHVTIPRIPQDDYQEFMFACAVMCANRIDNFANGVRFVHLTEDQIRFLEDLTNVRDINVIRNDDGSYVML
jgi:hypothetical protein